LNPSKIRVFEQQKADSVGGSVFCDIF